jgi:hypothetical protein
MRTQGMKYHTLPLNIIQRNQIYKKSHYKKSFIFYTSKRYYPLASIQPKTVAPFPIKNILSNRKILQTEPLDDKFKE